LPLYFDLTPESKRQLVLAALVKKIEADSNHVGTGFVGTPFILTGLSDQGCGELAYSMANQKTYPGWYDMVYNHGSRIFKEDWKGGLVQMPPLGGGLGYWFYHSLAGIQPDSSAPGFKKVIIRPDFINDLTSVRGEYTSIYGTIHSEWTRVKNTILLTVEIPPNTTAKVYLPTSNINNIEESGKPIVNSKDISFIRIEKEKTIIQIRSGKYSFMIK
jgi:alpha-L-rhamnosidase